MGQLAILFAMQQQQFQRSIRLATTLAKSVHCCGGNFRRDRIDHT